MCSMISVFLFFTVYYAHLAFNCNHSHKNIAAKNAHNHETEKLDIS